ncbi:MAG: hypothetical protein MRY83_21780, partial [Flavobacteriales bacterium]|nr:hypothetical protein [Flavobacteriales bacterium]
EFSRVCENNPNGLKLSVAGISSAKDLKALDELIIKKFINQGFQTYNSVFDKPFNEDLDYFKSEERISRGFFRNDTLFVYDIMKVNLSENNFFIHVHNNTVNYRPANLDERLKKVFNTARIFQEILVKHDNNVLEISAESLCTIEVSNEKSIGFIYNDQLEQAAEWTEHTRYENSAFNKEDKEVDWRVINDLYKLIKNNRYVVVSKVLGHSDPMMNYFKTDTILGEEYGSFDSGYELGVLYVIDQNSEQVECVKGYMATNSGLVEQDKLKSNLNVNIIGQQKKTIREIFPKARIDGIKNQFMATFN